MITFILGVALSKAFARSIVFFTAPIIYGYCILVPFFTNYEVTKDRYDAYQWQSFETASLGNNNRRNMRPNVLISILLILGLVLFFWCPSNGMALANPRRRIYIITHRPRRHRHRVKITNIYLRRWERVEEARPRPSRTEYRPLRKNSSQIINWAPKKLKRIQLSSREEIDTSRRAHWDCNRMVITPVTQWTMKM